MTERFSGAYSFSFMEDFRRWVNACFMGIFSFGEFS